MRRADVPGLVSIVVASYNHARFLDRRMESLLSQTYDQIEIIVIDDCSPDESVAVLRKYESHPNVRLIIREQNGGWVTVSNQGAALARGEYLLFANCDDACEPEMIAELVAQLRRHPSAAIAYCRSVLMTENDEIIGDDFAGREPAFKRRAAQTTLLERDEIRRFLMRSCVIPNLSAALMRRTVFESAGGLTHDYRVCCDWDLFFRMTESAGVVYVVTPLNHFRQHARTIRSTTKERVVIEEYLRLLLGQLRRLGVSMAERQRLRAGVMSVWAENVLVPSAAGIRSFGYHLGRVARYDAPSLAFVAPAFLWRAVRAATNVLTGRRSDGAS